MNKTALLSLIYFSLVFTCHPSCECLVGTEECFKCKLEEIGSVMDSFKRSCPCPPGYQIKSEVPFQCSQLQKIQVNSNISNKNFQNPDLTTSDLQILACKMECLIKAQDVKIIQNSYYLGEYDTQVIVELSLNLVEINILEECINQFHHYIQYFNPKINDYVDLDPKYIQNEINGKINIKIPINDIYNITFLQSVGKNQINQSIKFISLIGTSDKILKKIKWPLEVYTQRYLVDVIKMSVDLQKSFYPKDREIADLEPIVKQVYQDSSFSIQKLEPYSYFVGDIMYIKLALKQPAAKYIKFQTLKCKDEKGSIYDLSTQANHRWEENSLYITLSLEYATYQTFMLIQVEIDQIQNRRLLQNSDAEMQTKQKVLIRYTVEEKNTNSLFSEKNTNSLILINFISKFILIMLMIY